MAGHSGMALSFDGVNDQVTIPHAADLSFTATDSFTLAAWVNAPTLPGAWAGIVTKSRDAGPHYGLWISPANLWTLGGPTNIFGNTATTGWHHIALVQDAGQRYLYVDGIVQASGPAQNASGGNGNQVSCAPEKSSDGEEREVVKGRGY